jgi:hypothetical protein
MSQKNKKSTEYKLYFVMMVLLLLSLYSLILFYFILFEIWLDILILLGLSPQPSPLVNKEFNQCNEGIE